VFLSPNLNVGESPSPSLLRTSVLREVFAIPLLERCVRFDGQPRPRFRACRISDWNV